MTAPGRVLVTGASGFIGRNVLAALLQRGLEAHAVTHLRTPQDAPDGVRWHRADLLAAGEQDALLAAVRPSHLLHLAWYAEPGLYWHSLENLRWTAATIGLVQAFAAQGGRRVVLAGTCAEYRWGEPGPYREGVTPLAPATLYGMAKLCTHQVLRSAARELALEVACGRVFFVYGAGEAPQRLVASVARGLLAGERVATGDGTQVRDFLHVADVGRAFAALTDSAVTGAVNIGSGRGRRLREVVDAIAAQTGRADLLDIGALPPSHDDAVEIVADITRLRDELGFVPAVDLGGGVERTVAWWRARLGR